MIFKRGLTPKPNPLRVLYFCFSSFAQANLAQPQNKKPRLSSGFPLVEKNFPITMSIDDFVCHSNTNITQNLTLLMRLDKDLIAIEDFANFAWAIGRIKLGK